MEMSVDGCKLTQTGPDDTGKVEAFSEVLIFAEAIVKGSIPDSLPDSLKPRN
jgi:hypothetical protein